MNSILLSDPLLVLRPSSNSSPSYAKAFSCSTLGVKPSLSVHPRRRPLGSRGAAVAAASAAVARNGALGASSTPSNAIYTVGEFMTKRENLHVVKPTTTVDRALEMLVENRVTGFPVIDEDWILVGVVSDYDLLALDSISGSGRTDTSMFPEVDSTWKTFNEIQKLLNKTDGKVVGEVMTPAPLVVRETTNLEDAARLLLETKYRRLPVVDGAGKLVSIRFINCFKSVLYVGTVIDLDTSRNWKIGIITRGNVVRAALQIKHENEKSSQA